MPSYFFVWTPAILAHLAEHDVTSDEFEELVGSPESEDASRTTGERVAFGYTELGRYLCCIFRRLDKDTIEPITAFDAED